MATLEKGNRPIEHLQTNAHLRGGDKPGLESRVSYSIQTGFGSGEEVVVPDVFIHWKDIKQPFTPFHIPPRPPFRHPELISGSTDHEIPKQVRSDNALVDAGFFTDNELTSFFRSFNQGLSEGKTATEAVRGPLWGMVANIRSYLLEYAEQTLLLPHLVKLNTEGEIVNLNGAPIQIDPVERQGAYGEAKWKVEQSMAKAQDGSLAVITSPKGITGQVDKQGKPTKFPNSQTIIFWKERGQLQGITLVTDMTKEQNRQLLRDLGAPIGLAHDELSELADIVRNPALLGPDRGQSVVGVINKILNIRGYSDIKIINNKDEVEFRPVSEIFRDLASREELLRFNEVAEKCIEEFGSFVLTNAGNLNNMFLRRRLSEEIEATILRATRTILRKKNGLTLDYSELRLLDRPDYFGEELQHLKSWGGCSNSSSSMKALRGGLSSGGIFLDSSTSFSKTCTACGIRKVVEGGCGLCYDCGEKAA